MSTHMSTQISAHMSTQMSMHMSLLMSIHIQGKGAHLIKSIMVGIPVGSFLLVLIILKPLNSPKMVKVIMHMSTHMSIHMSIQMSICMSKHMSMRQGHDSAGRLLGIIAQMCAEIHL